MRKMFSLFIVASIIASCACAKDKRGEHYSPYYLRIDAGVSFPMSAPSPDIFFYQSNESKGAKSSAVLGIGGGYVFNKYARTDITLTHRPNFTYDYTDATGAGATNVSQTFSTTALMNNWYYYPIPMLTFFPYIHLGLGVSRNYSSAFKFIATDDNPDEITAPSKIKHNFVYSIGCGLQIPLTKNLYSDVCYKYINFNKFGKAYYKFKNNSASSTYLTPQLSSHEVNLGVVYRF